MILQYIQQEVLQNISDTLNLMMPKLDQIAEASNPTQATWNLALSAIAAITGIVGAWFGYKGYIWSKKTAKNVARTDPDIQLSLCKNLVKCDYRLFVRARGIALTPSLQHSPNLFADLNIPSFDDYFILPDYRDDDKQHTALVNLKYEILECNQAFSICRSHLEKSDTLTRRDLDNLLEKPADVLITLVKVSSTLSQKDYVDTLIDTCIYHHYEHIKNSTLALKNIGDWISEKPERFIGDDRGAKKIASIVGKMTELPQQTKETLNKIVACFEPHKEAYPIINTYVGYCRDILSNGNNQKESLLHFIKIMYAIDSAIEVVQMKLSHYSES